MLKILILLLLFFINANSIYSQHYISGTILDSLTGNAINAASISNLEKGTLTDNNGCFKISNTKQNYVHISHIGYHSKKVIIDTIFKIIYLQPKTTNLHDVEVKSSIFNLFLDAISKIKTNYYYDNETLQEGWTKQSLIDLGRNTDTLNKGIEGIYDQDISQFMLYPAYKNSSEYPLIKYKDINQRIYRNIDSSKSSPESNFVNFIDDICDADFVLKRKNFIHHNSNKLYRYVSNGQKILDNRKVIEIFFYNNKNKNKIGTLYIDSQSHAFVACNFYEYSSKQYEAPLDYRNTFIQYKIDSNNKWNIKNIYVETKYSKTINIIMKQYYNNEFVRIYQKKDTIKFIKPPLIDYLDKTNITTTTKINSEQFNKDNHAIDSILKNNHNLKLENNSYTQKKIKKSTYFTKIILNPDNFNVLFLLQNLENYEQLSYNIFVKIRLYKNLYYYRGGSISKKILTVFSPQYIVVNRFDGIGYKIPFSSYFPKYSCLIYSGYSFEKIAMKNNTIFSQDDIFLGCQFERRINKNLGFILDIGAPIVKLNNYNNTEIIKNRNVKLGLGISYRIN